MVVEIFGGGRRNFAGLSDCVSAIYQQLAQNSATHVSGP